MKHVAFLLAICWSARLLAGVVAFEGDAFPEAEGWERVGTFDCDRWLDPAVGGEWPGAWFCHYCDLGAWDPPPIGETDSYRVSVAPFAWSQAWFLEWELWTDAPSWILDTQGTPVVVSAYGNGNALYHFTITDRRIRVVRDTSLPVIYLDVEPGVHKIRLELHGEEEYAWWVDDVLIDSGTPYGMYPGPDSRIIWGSRYFDAEVTSCWRFLRYGDIPLDGSGDFDSSSTVDGFDWYFFREYFSGKKTNAGPGGRWADFDFDGDVDCADLDRFAEAWTASVRPPLYIQGCPEIPGHHAMPDPEPMAPVPPRAFPRPAPVEGKTSTPND